MRATGGGLRHAGLLTLASGATFAAMLALHRSGATRDLDREALLRLRELHGEWLDLLGAADDLFFRPTPTFVAALVLAIVLFRFGPRWSWCAPLAIVLTALVEVIVKNGWGQVLHARAIIDGVQVLFGGRFHAPASFPSGHVARAMFLAVMALSFMPRKVSLPLVLFALTTPFARMYTETHRLGDVLGGAALGICIGCAAVWGTQSLRRLTRERGKRSRAEDAR